MEGGGRVSVESIGPKYVLHFDGPEDFDPGAEPCTHIQRLLHNLRRFIHST